MSPRGRGSPRGGRLEASVQKMHGRVNPVASPQPSTSQASSMLGVMGAAPVIAPGGYPRGVVQMLKGEVVSKTSKSLTEMQDLKDRQRAYQERESRDTHRSGRESASRDNGRRSRHSSRHRSVRRQESDRSGCSSYSGYSRENSLDREEDEREAYLNSPSLSVTVRSSCARV